jgi:hypothetical protein
MSVVVGRVERVLAELDPATRTHDPDWLRQQIAGFDELERPIAARMLIERLKPASQEEREETLDALRTAGVIELVAHSTSQRMPWRRALAIRTLGWVGATEAVPLLIEEVGLRRYRSRDLMLFGTWSLAELLWYRPLTALWRTWATVLVLTGRRPGWGSIPRGAAFREKPEAELVAAPLPR